MKKIVLFFLIIFICVIGSIITVLIYTNSITYGVYNYDMDVRIVDDKVTGFNLDTDALHFGSFGGGGIATRHIEINHVEDDMKVVVLKHGDMAGWVSNENNFILQKNQNYNLSFTLFVPSGTPIGNYTGRVVIKLLKK